MAAGIAIYSYAGSRLVLLLAIVYLAYAFSSDRTLWNEWPKFLVFGLTLGMVVFPIGFYFWQHPDIAGARLNQVGVFETGWIKHEIQLTHKSVVHVMAEQVATSFLYFVSSPAASMFWNSPGPLYDGLWSLFLMLGLLFSLLSLRELRHVWLQLWFGSVIVFGGALIVPPPSAARLVMAFPVVAVFGAWGIYNVTTLLLETLKARRWIAQGLMAAAALALAATSLNFYFFDYTSKYYFADANSEVGHELGQYLATAPREAHVYFFGEPRMFYGFPSIPFLSKNFDGMDVHPGDDVARWVQPGREAIFIALPQRRGNMEVVRQLYPGGTYWEVPRRTRPEEPLYLAYTVKP